MLKTIIALIIAYKLLKYGYKRLKELERRNLERDLKASR